MTDPTGPGPPPIPSWADPDNIDFDPLLSLNWPPSDPPPHAGADRKAWDDTLRLLAAAATALLAARPAHVSTAALAAKLGVTPGTVRRWVREKKVVALKRGQASQARLFIPVSELDRLTAGRPLTFDPLSPIPPRGDS
jgi:transposase-like protein